MSGNLAFSMRTRVRLLASGMVVVTCDGGVTVGLATVSRMRVAPESHRRW